MRPLIHTFTPMFFVMVGVSLNLNTVDWSASFVWHVAGLLMVVAIVGKWLAGFAIREPRFVQTVIGLCGPKPMTDTAQWALRKLGVPLERVHFELFDMV